MDCWLYAGWIQNKGYGVIYNPATKKHETIHRIIYENYYGEIPNNLVVRHKCDIPRCINPKHLELGTQSDNMMDSVRRGRHGNSRISAIACRNGHPRTQENTQVFWRKDHHRFERRCRVCRRKSLQTNY
jgi:hypothetical protein